MDAVRGPRADRSGFALVGLLIVIAVVGAVSVGAVIATNAMSGRSQLAVCRTDARMIRAAVETDRASTRPSDTPSLATLVARGFLPRPTRYHTISYSGSNLALHPVGACAGRAYTP